MTFVAPETTDIITYKIFICTRRAATSVDP